MPIPLTTEQRATLRDTLGRRLSPTEFKTLCDDIDVDYEDLGGEGLAGKARELVIYVERRGGDFAPLLDWLRRNRPDISRDLASTIPELDVSAPPPHPGPRYPIVNIPPRNEYFTGRADLLDALGKALGAGGATAITQPLGLHGLGGVGKSQLAIEFFYRHETDYDVAWWLRAEDPTVLAGDIALLAIALKLPEAAAPDQSEAVAAVLRWLDGHARWLLVFDNATAPVAVAPCIPAHPHGHVLITSRYAVWDELAADVPVDTLPPDDAVAFLLKRARQKDRDAAGDLAKDLGYLPLALEQAAGYMRAEGVPLAEYLETFRTERLALLAEGKPLRYPDTVATTWLISFGQAGQTPGAADLLSLLAFLAPDDIPLGILRDGRERLPDGLAAIVGSKMKFQKAVGALHTVSLLRRADDTVSVHRLVQAVARDRLAEDERQVWAEAAARVASKAFPYDSDDVRTWPECAALLPHALAGAEYAEILGVAGETAASLLHQVTVYLWGRAEYARAADLLRRALRIGEQTLGAEHPDVAVGVNNLGNVLRYQGDLAGARALLDRALRIGEETLGAEHPTVAIRLNNLGNVLRYQGDLAGARALLDRALRIDEKVYGPDDPNVAIRLNNLGNVLRDQGDLVGAWALYKRALRIWETKLGPEDPKVATAANNLGGVLHAQGDLAGARALFERALRIDEKVYGTDHPEVATDLNNLGEVLHDERNLAGAQALYERALRIFEARLGPDHPSVAAAAYNLGEVLHDERNLAGARALYKRALRIFETRLGPEHPNTQLVRRNLAALGR
ncbi:MAG: FxSxx-COOH system tetratricopeptide repeat protein [Anaerolineae bacterium]